MCFMEHTITQNEVAKAFLLILDKIILLLTAEFTDLDRPSVAKQNSVQPAGQQYPGLFYN